ncbi:MAG: hypothetical protein L6Q37_04005, partial [Bdellovibrionaceae bacterium]|nr:hypothetical protein [Pseudobdellovibrionaceae bacterium]
MKKDSEDFKKYNQQIHSTRVSFLKSSGINYFMTESDPKKLHAFLLVWTAMSIQMTERVEDWIKRAGENCTNKNFTEVGEKLQYHSKQEADHDKMLVTDVNFLIEKWNKVYNDTLTLNDLFKIGTLPETQYYVDLHENVINSQHPYCQTAIEFEIERISVVYGPRMIDNLLFILGDDFEPGISFLAEHVLLDQGHTKFNIDLMEKCLAAKASLSEMVKTGSDALTIYAGFLNHCIKISHSLLERTQWNSHLA